MVSLEKSATFRDHALASPGSSSCSSLGSPPDPDASAVEGSLMPIPAPGERDLRLDLFRGIALWLIFLDHIPSNIVNWITIRNYGFSDATEIFVFISGYTAAFVYGRAMREHGVVVASARILKRAWQVYVAHVFLFAIYMAEISYVAASFENPLYGEEMGIFDFLRQPDITLVQALLLKFKPANMDVLPLYIVLLAGFPPMLWILIRAPAVGLGASLLLYLLTWNFGWNLPAYPNGYWVFNPFAWQLLFVFGAWCGLGGAKRLAPLIRSPVTLAVAILYLRVRLRHRVMTWYIPGLDRLRAPLARRLDVSDRQDESRRAACRPFHGARRVDRPPGAAAMAVPALAVAAAGDPVRPAFPRNLLPGGVSFLCRPFCHGRDQRGGRDAGRRQPVGYYRNGCDSRPHFVV
jgi:hypothetical protein